jgi:hypothetical protein
METVELLPFSVPFGDGTIDGMVPLADGGAVVLTGGALTRYDAGGATIASVEVEDPASSIISLDDGLALGRADGTVEIWDLDQMEVARTVAGPNGVAGSRFVDGGRRIMLTDGAGDTLLYDLEADTSVGWLLGQQAQNISGVPNITSDGAFAWLAVDARFVKVPLDPAAWRARACELAGRELTAEEWAALVPGDERRRDICA